MPKLAISFASCPYDRLNPIISGRVPIEGCDVNFFPLRPEELFPRVYQTQDFDVTELSASSHILTALRDAGDVLVELRCAVVIVPDPRARHPPQIICVQKGQVCREMNCLGFGHRLSEPLDRWSGC